MTTAARLSHIGPVHGRAGILGGQDGAHIAIYSVAVQTARCRLSVCAGLGVDTILDSSVRIFVKFLSAEVRQSLAGTVASATVQIYVRGKFALLLIC
jgi:hypothetical protein